MVSFFFTPQNGEDFQFDSYFSDGLVQPLTSLNGAWNWGIPLKNDNPWEGCTMTTSDRKQLETFGTLRKSTEDILVAIHFMTLLFWSCLEGWWFETFRLIFSLLLLILFPGWRWEFWRTLNNKGLKLYSALVRYFLMLTRNLVGSPKPLCIIIG